MDDAPPPTESQGSLVPPGKPPITALATMPSPEPNRHARHPSSFGRSTPLRDAIRATLDTVDSVADAIASGLGLR
ncbi:MAG TPA: hypothetical protein VGM67_05145 [Gemmatimonadaceae bacterium]|jgi:hypothetical protein